MKRYTWSIILSVSNFILAALLFVLGQREFRSLASLPGAFYDGSVGYIPFAQQVSYCLNAPSLVISAPIRHWLMGHIIVSSLRVTYGDMEYGLIVFLFWWWVGSKLDAVGRVQQGPSSRFAKIFGYIFGLTVSLLLLYGGVTGLAGKGIAGKPILISMTFWGLGLLYYFAIRSNGNKLPSAARHE